MVGANRRKEMTNSPWSCFGEFGVAGAVTRVKGKMRSANSDLQSRQIVLVAGWARHARPRFVQDVRYAACCLFADLEFEDELGW